MFLILTCFVVVSWGGNKELFAVASDSPAANPLIEVANQSGVSGYSIGIFGTDFGTSEGNLSILGTEAQIELWTDTFVRAIIPATDSGSGMVELTTADGGSDTSPFELYVIEPMFLATPATTFQNIASGKRVAITNLNGFFCYRQPDNTEIEPSLFLTDYRCGSAGVTGDGRADFSVAASDAVIAIDLEDMVTGNSYFQFFNGSSWYTDNPGAPRDYVIEVSSNTTNGVNGSWQILHSEIDNNRSARIHKIEMPSDGARWIRLRVSTTTSADNIFMIKELRLYQEQGSGSSKLDLLALYGDSITSDAAEIIGHLGLAEQIREVSRVEQDLLLSVYGLAGQNSGGLLEQPDVDFDIYDALALDSVGNLAKYWGIALGTNDSLDSMDVADEIWSNLGGYDERLEQVIQELIARGVTPLIARIPDTDEAQGGFGTLASKQKILTDIDRLAAQYRLIPGPDMYTAYRHNIEFEGGTWIREGDGTHHSNEGRLQFLTLWAEAFVKGTNRGNLVPIPTAIPTTIPTNSPTPLSTNTPTNTPAPLPTSTPTLLPTSTLAPIDTATPLPTSTPRPNATVDTLPDPYYVHLLPFLQQ